MSKLLENALTEGFSGSLGKIVLKRYRHGTVISKIPDMSKVVRTNSQKKNSARFVNAVEFAKGVLANPAERKKYEMEARRTGRTIYHLALSEYMKDTANK